MQSLFLPFVFKLKGAFAVTCSPQSPSNEMPEAGRKGLTCKLDGRDGGGVVIQGLLQIVVLLHVQYVDQSVPTGRGEQGQPCECRGWPRVPGRLLDALASQKAV